LKLRFFRRQQTGVVIQIVFIVFAFGFLRFGNQRFELMPNTFPRNVSLLGVDLDSIFVHRPEETAGLMREVASFYAQGAIRPLPVTVFPPSRIAEAFGHLAERRNIGRATVSMRAGDVRIPPRSSPGLRPDATYLITGGLGGFGLATAQWLVDNGARHLALLHAAEIADRCVAMATGGEISDVDGGPLRLAPESICVHGDTPGAVEIARRVRDALTGAGVDLAPFAP